MATTTTTTAAASTTTTTITPQTPTRIAIIGAGLAGLSLALFLHRLPHTTVTILEARPSTAPDGGYLALAPNALHVLDQLGLYETLLPHGCAYEELTMYSARTLAPLAGVLNGSYALYGYPALRIERHVVRRTLVQAVQGVGIKVGFGVKVVGVREEGRAVKVVVLAAGENKEQEQEFDVVVGADGIHSRVRRLISSVEPTFSGMGGVGGGRLRRSQIGDDLRLPCLLMGKANSFMMMPTAADGQTVSCFATVEMEARSREGWAQAGEDKAGLKKMLVDRHCGEGSEWPDVVQQACRESEAESLTIWPFFNAPVLESWTTKSSRVILVGDAAHAMPPTGGQGAGQAFEDVASLATVFATCSADGDSFDEGVRAWQTRRQERVRKIKAFTSTNADMRRASPSSFQQILREWLVWAVLLWKGKDAGLGWIYSHREEGPKVAED
ncbi:uncharacterized protein HMPREF1541_05732 [Cyphellophora europaea CBS 101466]|uniref:FAD-binding domain-containing protein n=1 Tax=Cyphellophora europaea (strain CBS 101466) TaxID=1220924 RepID=W2RSM1_CYPE1|nr:uncharacterized protein HMPREF1541_05732 [Cyphellophora europaea CBS 101466]ETN39506.1 hypothetical protein HMPREF1541_05732 [Cyphellophora europaea CBS 101466]